MAKEKKTLEDKVTELTSLLGDEEERAKQLAKTKNKYESIIAALEEQLKKEQEVQTLSLANVAKQLLFSILHLQAKMFCFAHGATALIFMMSLIILDM